MSKLLQRHGRALCLGATLAVGLCASAPAAEPNAEPVKALEQKLDQSLKMIDALAARVRELEAKQSQVAAKPAPAPAAAVADERLQSVEQKVAQIETANAARRGDDTGLPIHGFADINVGNHNPYHPYFKGASLNNLDFYLTPKLGDKLVSLFELNVEVGSDGGVGIDIERGQIGYQVSDQATVWVGRFHTPYGYVNTALHHGIWLNDALRRPAFLMFEDQGGIMPAHTVGGWVTGAVRGEGGKVLYDAYYGNGQQIIDGIVDMRTAGNEHGRPIYGARLGYQWTSGALEGLSVGVNALDSHITDDAAPQNMTDVRIYGAYAVYDTDNWEILGEGYQFDNDNLYTGNGSHRSKAYFAQAGYRLPMVIPYARYERALLDQTDQYFAALRSGGSYYRTAAGLRHDLNLKAALKFEVANTHYTDRDVGSFNEFLAQLAIRF